MSSSRLEGEDFLHEYIVRCIDVARQNSHHGNSIIVKYGRDVFAGELIGRVTDQQTGVANSTVADHNTSIDPDVSF